MFVRSTSLVSAIAALFVLGKANAQECATSDSPKDHFPNYFAGGKYQKIVANGRRIYRGEMYDYQSYLNDHTPFGNYFHYDVTTT